jgi:hypothetical protein
MAQAVSHLLLTAEAWVGGRFCLCEICGGQRDIETGFLSVFFGFFWQYHSTVALHISSGGLTIGPLVAALQRQSEQQ